MAKKRRQKRGSRKAAAKPRSKFWFAAIIGVAAIAAYHLASREPLPEVPDPDRSKMEPQVAEKIQTHREAVLADPRSSLAWGRLGTVFQAHGREAEASECYRRAIDLDPEDFRWPYLLAHAMTASDRQTALLQAEQASKVRPDYAPTYVLRGQLLEEDNQPELAREQYQKALSHDPRCAMAAFSLGRLYLSQGELDASLGHLRRAAELSEDAGAIHASLAQVYRRLGDKEAMTQEAQLASELRGAIAIDDPVHYQMRKESVSSISLLEGAKAAAQAGRDEEAEELYARLVEIRPDDADMRTRWGDTLARLGKNEAAKEQYLAALEINPEHAAALYGLGNMLNFEGSHDEALWQYRKAAELRREHVPTLLNLGGILAFQGKLDEAAKVFRQALEIEPKSFGPHRQLGQVLLRQENFPEAISHFRAALEVRPDFGNVHLQLAVALASTGEFRKAWKHVERAQELGEEVPPELREELQKWISD